MRYGSARFWQLGLIAICPILVGVQAVLDVDSGAQSSRLSAAVSAQPATNELVGLSQQPQPTSVAAPTQTQATQTQATQTQATQAREAADQGENRAAMQEAPVQQPATPGQAPAQDDIKLSFNFKFAPWESVLRWYAAMAGLTYDVSQLPPGTFSYEDDRQHDKNEVLDVLNRYLIPRGFLILRRDRFLTTLKLDEGIPPTIVVDANYTNVARYADTELIRMVVPISSEQEIDVQQVTQEVQQLLGAHGRAVGLSNSNSIAISGLALNVRRVYQLLRGSRKQSFREFSIVGKSAYDVELIVKQLLQGGSVRLPTGRVNLAGDQVQLFANSANNSLLAVGPPDKLETIGEIVETLTDGTKGGTGKKRQVREVVRLRGADAVVMSEVLGKLIPRVKSVTPAESRSNDALPTKAIIRSPQRNPK